MHFLGRAAEPGARLRWTAALANLQMLRPWGLRTGPLGVSTHSMKQAATPLAVGEGT